MMKFILLALFTMATEAAEMSLLGRFPGFQKRASVRELSQKLLLESNHSALIPRVKGIGRFTSSTPLELNEQKQISEEKRKLSVRNSFVQGLPEDRSHGFFIKLDAEEFVSLDEPFGKDLSTLFDKLLDRKWIPDEAVTFGAGKLHFWSGGKLKRSLLPSQASECRWENEFWSCEFQTGIILSKDLR